MSLLFKFMKEWRFRCIFSEITGKKIPWWFLIGLFIKKMLMKNKNKNLQNVIVVQIYERMKI